MDAFITLKDFLRLFVGRIIKHKKDSLPKTILNHFCKFLSKDPKKLKHKILSLVLLFIFISNADVYMSFYSNETFEEVKNICLSALTSKTATYQEQALKIIRKVPYLQKNDLIMKQLDELLVFSNVKLKKDILNIIDLSDKANIKYLIELHNDESSDLRYFIFEKLGKINSFKDLDEESKVKILISALSESNDKARVPALNLLKKYLKELDILTQSQT